MLKQKKSVDQMSYFTAVNFYLTRWRCKTNSLVSDNVHLYTFRLLYDSEVHIQLSLPILLLIYNNIWHLHSLSIDESQSYV